MRLTNLFLLAALITGSTVQVPVLDSQDKKTLDDRSGTAPRASADKYHAHAQQDGVSVGAELLTPKEVSKQFAANLNRCCLVVLVAVYPKKDGLSETYRDDFTLIVEGSETPLRPESATVVAAKLEKSSGASGVATTGEAGVGYESGTYTDPVTGQQVHAHGVSTSVGVGVGVGNGTPAQVADREREVTERELSEKHLPEAKIAVPVSGYLYFFLPKTKKDSRYRLEYAANGTTIVVSLP
jgi:hypothetical protein